MVNGAMPFFGLISRVESLVANICARARTCVLGGGRGQQGGFTPELRPSLLGRFGSTNTDPPFAKLGRASVLPWPVPTRRVG